MPTPPGFTPSIKGQAARDRTYGVGRIGQKKKKRGLVLGVYRADSNPTADMYREPR